MPPQLPEPQKVKVRARRGRDRGQPRAPKPMTGPIVQRYFAYNACSKGSNCPYLHDSKNLFQGPKPQALKDKQANAGAAQVNAGAGTVLAGVLSANTISGSKASEVSCSDAPCQGVMQKVESIKPRSFVSP